MKFGHWVITTLIAAALPLEVAHAQTDTYANQWQMEHAWYGAVFGGVTTPGDLVADLSRIPTPPIPGLETRLLSDHGPLAGAALGVEFADMVRVEAELSATRNSIYEFQTTSPLFSNNGVANGEIQTIFAMANLWIDLPNESPITPYVGGGIGKAFLSGSFTEFGNVHTITQQHYLAYQIGFGAAYALTDNFEVDLGYRFRGVHGDIEITNPIIGPYYANGMNSHAIQAGGRFTF